MDLSELLLEKMNLLTNQNAEIVGKESQLSHCHTAHLTFGFGFVWITRCSSRPSMTSSKPDLNLNNTPSLQSDIWHGWLGNADMLCSRCSSAKYVRILLAQSRQNQAQKNPKFSRLSMISYEGLTCQPITRQVPKQTGHLIPKPRSVFCVCESICKAKTLVFFFPCWCQTTLAVDVNMIRFYSVLCFQSRQSRVSF